LKSFLPILFLTTLLCLCGCGDKPIKKGKIVGRYQAVLENGTDVITLNENNHFTEEICYRSGKKLLNQGEWGLSDNSIALKNAFGLNGSFSLPDKYLPTTFVVLPVQTRWGNVQSFGIDEFAVYVKEQ
jgi:hypothetical protein